MLNRCPIPSTHLQAKTNSSERKISGELLRRGVEQRNAGIEWLRNNRLDSVDGVVYFGDDDNTYDLELFDEVNE